MNIRHASLDDIEELKQLYFDTITFVNSKDYNKEQIEAWATTSNHSDSFRKKIQQQNFYVAENQEKRIAGFASLEDSGYLDMMYVHKDFQNKGIAKALLDTILKKAKSLQIASLETQASITAKSFFEKHDFLTILEQTVYINNIGLTNYKMRRILTW